MPPVLRIIDANANRAREALRVMEEAARFILDDTPLTTDLKNLRHDLAATLAQIPALEFNRDTPGDVGTTVKTASEAFRGSPADVVIAAGKRLSEALRAIEEYAKTLPPLAPHPGAGSGDGERASRPDEIGTARERGGVPASLPAAIEALRYRGYDIEQRLTRALSAGRPGKQRRLCVLITQQLCPRGDWFAVARAAIAGGADCLQLREKEVRGAELLNRARQLVALCRPAGVSAIINDHPAIALLSGADGVHVGQTDLPVSEVRRLVGRQLIVGVSTSNLAQAQKALSDGADYCGVGPMFPTTTVNDKQTIAGPAYLREYLSWGKLPHLAIGGIGPKNLPQLVTAGVRGIAVSSAVCAASDPQAAARRMLDLLKSGT